MRPADIGLSFIAEAHPSQARNAVASWVANVTAIACWKASASSSNMARSIQVNPQLKLPIVVFSYEIVHSTC